MEEMLLSISFGIFNDPVISAPDDFFLLSSDKVIYECSMTYKLKGKLPSENLVRLESISSIFKVILLGLSGVYRHKLFGR